jgi:hypothetical protein
MADMSAGITVGAGVGAAVGVGAGVTAALTAGVGVAAAGLAVAVDEQPVTIAAIAIIEAASFLVLNKAVLLLHLPEKPQATGSHMVPVSWMLLHPNLRRAATQSPRSRQSFITSLISMVVYGLHTTERL